MNRNRSKAVEWVVITKSDLETIWALLDRNSRIEGTKNPSISVSSAGNVRTESDSDDIFDNDVIDLKKTTSLEMSFSNYLTGKSIHISLHEGSKTWRDSGFSVSGNDLNWVDATFVDLETIFAAIRPQFTLVHRFRWPIRLALAISAGISMLLIWSLIGPPTETTSIHMPTWLNWIVALGACALIGAIPGDYLFDRLNWLWPTVEFDFGPEHFKRRKRIRANLTFVLTIFLLPLIIELIVKLALRH